MLTELEGKVLGELEEMVSLEVTPHALKEIVSLAVKAAMMQHEFLRLKNSEQREVGTLMSMRASVDERRAAEVEDALVAAYQAQVATMGLER